MRVENQKTIRVAINGFGRIGRNFLRCWEGRENSLLDVVAINDSGGVKQASHLLKYDSTLGKFDAEVKVVDDKTLAVNGKNIAVRTPPSKHTNTHAPAQPTRGISGRLPAPEIPRADPHRTPGHYPTPFPQIVSSRDPTTLPWKDMNIDLVIEGTGVFLDTPGAGKHLQVSAGPVAAGRGAARQCRAGFVSTLLVFPLPILSHRHLMHVPRPSLPLPPRPAPRRC